MGLRHTRVMGPGFGELRGILGRFAPVMTPNWSHLPVLSVTKKCPAYLLNQNLTKMTGHPCPKCPTSNWSKTPVLIWPPYRVIRLRNAQNPRRIIFLAIYWRDTRGKNRPDTRGKNNPKFGVKPRRLRRRLRSRQILVVFCPPFLDIFCPPFLLSIYS